MVEPLTGERGRHRLGRAARGWLCAGGRCHGAWGRPGAAHPPPTPGPAGASAVSEWVHSGGARRAAPGTKPELNKDQLVANNRRSCFSAKKLLSGMFAFMCLSPFTLGAPKCLIACSSEPGTVLGFIKVCGFVFFPFTGFREREGERDRDVRSHINQLPRVHTHLRLGIEPKT